MCWQVRSPGQWRGIFDVEFWAGSLPYSVQDSMGPMECLLCDGHAGHEEGEAESVAFDVPLYFEQISVAFIIDLLLFPTDWTGSCYICFWHNDSIIIWSEMAFLVWLFFHDRLSEWLMKSVFQSLTEWHMSCGAVSGGEWHSKLWPERVHQTQSRHCCLPSVNFLQKFSWGWVHHTWNTGNKYNKRQHFFSTCDFIMCFIYRFKTV